MQHSVRSTLIFPVLAATAGLLWQLSPLTAQTVSSEQAPRFTEAVQVRVINVEVTVTDKQGVPVAALGVEDFALEVDGEPTPITNFYAEAGGRARQSRTPADVEDSTFRTVEEVAAEPRGGHIVVLVDHSRLHLNNRKRALRAMRQAVDQLEPQDKVAVVGVEGSLVFYSDFLYDRKAVDRILNRMQTVSIASDVNEAERRQILGELTRGMSGGIQARFSLAEEGPLKSRIQAYAAQEYSRSVRSLQTIEQVISTLSGVSGRKVLFYVGEGIPTRPGEGLFVEWRNRFGGGNPEAGIGLRRIDFNIDYTTEVGRYDLSQAMQALAKYANRSGVTLYAVDAENSHGGAMRAALTEQGATSESVSVVDENFREPLEYASKATGGRWLQASGRLDERLSEVIADFGVYYSLGFSPPPDWQPGADHDIEVRVKRKGLQARHRESVAVPRQDEQEAAAVVAALVYHATPNPLGVTASAESTSVQRDDGTVALPINLEIPVSNLGLVPTQTVHAGSLTFYVTTRSEDGTARAVQKIPFDLNIPEEMLQQAQSESAHYPLPVVLRPGDQQVAIGVRDNVSGVFSAVRLDVAEYAPKL